MVGMEPKPYKAPQAHEHGLSPHFRPRPVTFYRIAVAPLSVVIGAAVGAIIADIEFGSSFGMGNNTGVQILGALAGGVLSYLAFVRPSAP
jgi:hypothetical protein